jgi:mono/diheme cytochrome c family protein
MKTILMAGVVMSLLLISYGAHGQGKTDQESGTVHSIELPVMQVQLKPGPGLEKVAGLCAICHTLKYITMQPPLPRSTWTAEVNKMIKVMGAPINEEDAKTIIDYLSTEYGTGK